jgi:2-keto-3-deoxy-L-rhamnonate aldolase RhmA
MKIAALQKLRKKLAADEAVYGLWITLESASISEMAVALGLDWIVVDAEHGHLDWKEILEHVRATVRSDTVVLVRIAELNAGAIKRALDIGADGVMIPWIETAEQLRQAVAFATYPPEGIRGIGAERATAWGQCFLEHAQEANENVLVVPIVESVTGGKNIQSLLQVGGVEIVFIGPADYSSTAGFRGQWEGPGVAKQLLAIKDAVRASGKHCGVVTTSHENLLERQAQGFRMLGFGTDSGLFLRSLRAALGVVGRDRPMSLTLAPDKATLPMTPLPHPFPLPKGEGRDEGEGTARKPTVQGRRRALRRER